MPRFPPRTEQTAVEDAGDLTDLLSELRVLLPTAQLLSAFLITVPFTPGFPTIAANEKGVFVATFILSIVSLILLSAPAVQHRLVRPLRNRAAFKRLASAQILCGSVALALALVLVVQLILSAVFGHLVGNAVSAFIAALVIALWWLVPKYWRACGHI